MLMASTGLFGPGRSFSVSERALVGCVIGAIVKEGRMDIYLVAVQWIGLALLASLISVRVGVSIALVENIGHLYRFAGGLLHGLGQLLHLRPVLLIGRSHVQGEQVS